jgi:hypothetical protein
MGGMDEKGVQMHRYAIALLISTLAFLGCATPTVSEGAGPKQEQRDAQAAGQQEDRQGRIGETLRLSGNEHGLEMAVTPRRVVDPRGPSGPLRGSWQREAVRGSRNSVGERRHEGLQGLPC